MEGRELFHDIASSGQKRSAVPKEGLAYLITTLDGWTFIESSRGIFYCDVSKVDSAVGADVCLAWADSTTWSIGMEYATADGAKRSREFKLDAELITGGRSVIAKRPFKDGNGRTFGYEIVPSILIGKDGQLLPSSMFGKEHAEGAALPGEPTERQITDDESLIALLVSLKVPIGAILNRWHCSAPDILLKGDSSVLRMSGMYNDGRCREICVEMALRNNGGPDDRCQVLILWAY